MFQTHRCQTIVIVALAALVCSACAQRREQPNIVLIFTDDQGYGDVGVYGAKGFTTPHLDRLASEGIRFTDFYASQAVCSASRASLLTGSYAERVSIRGALFPGAAVGLHPDEETIADMLQSEGYATSMVGKWHLGHHEEFLPLQQGFDEYFGLPYSNDMWPVNYDGTPATEGNKPNFPPLPLIEGNNAIEVIDELADQNRLTTRYAERSVDFINRNHDQPFFLYLAHTMPHVPLGVSEKFSGHSEQGMYGDVIEEIDWSVGQILEALDEQGIADNTLVIFTSDNGPWLNYGNHAGSTGGLREGKGTAFEGGPRVPAIMRWPRRIPASTVSHRMASTIDILPTIAAITGASLPAKPIDGVNILPLLQGDETANPRDQFYFYYTDELRAVREGRWKRVFEHRTRSYVGVERGNDGYPGLLAFLTAPAALYDLENDPGETTDVAADHPEVVVRLDARADSVRRMLGDGLTGTVGTEVRAPGRRSFDRPDSTQHAGVGANVLFAAPPSIRYPGSGPTTVSDGLLGSQDIRDGRWLGFEGADVSAIVDLGGLKSVTRIGVDVLQNQQAWIFYPKSIEFALSQDGESWTVVHRAERVPKRQSDASVEQVTVNVDSVPARYVGVRAENVGTNPAWHTAAGGKSWLFLDEIMIDY